jgi:hypothetical protein
MAKSRWNWRDSPLEELSPPRGFIGIAFRIKDGQFVYIYLGSTAKFIFESFWERSDVAKPL